MLGVHPSQRAGCVPARRPTKQTSDVPHNRAQPVGRRHPHSSDAAGGPILRWRHGVQREEGRPSTGPFSCGWRRDPESNRARRICNPLHNRFAIAPKIQSKNFTKKGKRLLPFFNIWSGKRVSNSRPQPWQGCALPTELFPHFKPQIIAQLLPLFPQTFTKTHINRVTGSILEFSVLDGLIGTDICAANGRCRQVWGD